MLVVIEGLDGSGKGTQTKLTAQRLKEQGRDLRQITFPDYDSESSALVKMYLSGAFGDKPDDVNAHAASSFYAVDRFASYRQDWGRFYESGVLVIADRYTTSNAVHQTPKLPREERRAFLKWLFDFEYRLLELPKPDRVVYLDLPTEISEEMMRRREEKTHTQADIHERDEAYLAACRESAELIINLCGWEKIDCSRDGQIRSPEDIHREVLARVEDLLVP